MPVRACLVVTGSGAAVTRRPRLARPRRNVAASTRMGPGRCHNVLVRAWRLRDHSGRWGWRGAADGRGGGIGPHPDARHTADAPHLGTPTQYPRSTAKPASTTITGAHKRQDPSSGAVMCQPVTRPCRQSGGRLPRAQAFCQVRPPSDVCKVALPSTSQPWPGSLKASNAGVLVPSAAGSRNW
jgi:hypothetical protein